MDKAPEQMTSTNNTPQMIAEAIGYTQGNNFQASFEHRIGMTPREWKKRPTR